jgi:hypothetical protein
VAIATNASLPDDKLDALLVVIDDAKCEVIEASKLITTALAGPPHTLLQAQLDALMQAVTNPPDTGVPQQLEEVLALLMRPASKPRRPTWQWVGAGLLAGILCVGIGWAVARWGSGGGVREAALMRQLDPALAVHYSTLPAPVQSAIEQAYRQANLQSPGQRTKGAKR